MNPGPNRNSRSTFFNTKTPSHEEGAAHHGDTETQRRCRSSSCLRVLVVSFSSPCLGGLVVKKSPNGLFQIPNRQSPIALPERATRDSRLITRDWIVTI